MTNNAANNFVFYFGCWDQAGHYLWHPDRNTVRGRYESDRWRIPYDGQLDGGSLFLPLPEVVGQGALTHLPANDRTVLAWWGNPWDTRPGVNNSIIVSGHHTDWRDVWMMFEEKFPALAKMIPAPVKVRSSK